MLCAFLCSEDFTVVFIHQIYLCTTVCQSKSSVLCSTGSVAKRIVCSTNTIAINKRLERRTLGYSAFTI